MAIRSPKPRVELPVLETGMRLSADEFDRRYELRPDIKKAELVQGVVYVGSPVKIDHAEPDILMSTWLTTYRIKNSGLRTASNGTVRLSSNDRVQPDSMLWREHGGSASIGADRYMDGAPELAVEISLSSATYDMTTKKESYRRAGVQEYIVWLTEEDRILWFALADGAYVQLAADEDGWTESRVFPGLRLNIERLLDGEFEVLTPSAV